MIEYFILPHSAEIIRLIFEARSSNHHISITRELVRSQASAQTFAWLPPSGHLGFCSNVTSSTTWEGPAMTTLSKIALQSLCLVSCFFFLHSFYHYLTFNYICICLLSPLSLNVSTRDWAVPFLILFSLFYLQCLTKYLLNRRWK